MTAFMAASMIAINPCVVHTPDHRVGVLVGRLGIIGIVEFKPRRARGSIAISMLVPLGELGYLVAGAPDMPKM